MLSHYIFFSLFLVLLVKLFSDSLSGDQLYQIDSFHYLATAAVIFSLASP